MERDQQSTLPEDKSHHNSNSQGRCKSFELIVQFWGASPTLLQQHLIQHLPTSWQSSGGTWVFSVQKGPKVLLSSNTITRRYSWKVLRATESTKNNWEGKNRFFLGKMSKWKYSWEGSIALQVKLPPWSPAQIDSKWAHRFGLLFIKPVIKARREESQHEFKTKAIPECSSTARGTTYKPKIIPFSPRTSRVDAHKPATERKTKYSTHRPPTAHRDTRVVTGDAGRGWSSNEMLLERNHADTICPEILAWPRAPTEHLLLLPAVDLTERNRKPLSHSHCSHDIYSSEVEKAGYEWFKPPLVSVTYRNENRKQDNIH